MEIFISIDGVLRNTIQKFNYHYKDYYLESEIIDENNNFKYEIKEPVCNDNILQSYTFQSKEEYEFFTFVEFPIEIFGHAGLSYSNVITELNKLMYQNKDHRFSVISLDEIGKSKPGTLFFLSKNGFLGNDIKFRISEDIEKLWDECDYWITDNKIIIDKCPKNKKVIKFKTEYNTHFTHNQEISKLNEIEEPWLKSLEKTTLSISTESQVSAKQETQ